MTVQRLVQRNLTGLIVRRNESPPTNNPPEWDSQPAPVFTIGTAANYELDDLTSDPDMDTVTVSLNTGAVSLPTGVTWNDTLDRLEYDGVGAVDTTTGHIATADDGTDTTDSSAFEIQVRTAVVMDNWPFIVATFAIASVNVLLDNHPGKGIIEASNLFVHQGLFFNNSANRANTKTRLATLRAANPDIIIVIHGNQLTAEFDLTSSSGRAEWWQAPQAWANPSDYDEYFLRHTAGGPFLCHNFAQGKGLSFNWGCNNTVMQRFVDEQIAQYTDYDGVSDMMAEYDLSFMQDTIPSVDSRYKTVVHDGTVQRYESAQEVDIPIWSGVNVVGPPDGAGYFSMVKASSIVGVQSNHQDGSWETITGWKNVDFNTDRIRTQTSLDMNRNAGDEFYIFELSGNSGGTSGSGELSREEWRTGIKNFFTRYATTALTKGGVVGATRNGVVKDHRDKITGKAPLWATHEYDGYWDFQHAERCGSNGVGFFQVGDDDYWTTFQNPPGGAAGGLNYTPDNLLRCLEYGKLMLTTNALAARGYPCVILNAQTREPDFPENSNAKLDALTELDHAYALFWHCLAWCMDNVMPQVEMDGGHNELMMIDEWTISAGNPITARGFGSYDPEGDSDNGTFVFKTRDFGSFGFGFEFDNVFIPINLRQRDNTSIPWIPSYMAGGQTIVPAEDRITMPSAGAGFKWQMFSRSYKNPDSTSKYFNKGPTDYDTNERTLSGPLLNTGADVGSTYDCGPLETAVILRVPV